jgi:hypothetical protein
MHAYHNILVYFFFFPYSIAGNFWRHPVWFDILGLMLFVFGLSSVIELSWKNDVKKN